MHFYYDYSSYVSVCTLIYRGEVSIWCVSILWNILLSWVCVLSIRHVFSHWLSSHRDIKFSCTLSPVHDDNFFCVTLPTQTVTVAQWHNNASTPCLIPNRRTPQWFEVRQFLSRLTVPSQVLCQCIVLAVSTPTEIALSGSVTRDTIFTIFIQYYFVYIALHLVLYIT
jgi:hypothetical protein